MLVRALRALFRQYRIYRDPIAYARGIGVRIGHNCRLIGIDDRTFESEPYLVEIGDHVTVAGRVKFITHDGGVWVFREKEQKIEMCKPIIVGNNVFLGYATIILPGSRIGSNVVIGAGSVVRGEIPDDCVAAGIPAKPIRSLDDYRAKIEADVFERDWTSELDKREQLVNRFYP
ncbi:acyltransferase [Thiocystis violacea]|uniref:acyltransferase n=1 Tax=Thiocystis violacea TaxID=13725 RepID=UPI001F5C096E|nr:acyltransferase [Thiocystis violacea]MBK1725026.1 hypothetical protein [Thiocystis violacea]